MALVRTQRISYSREGKKHTASDAEITVRPESAIKVTSVTSQTLFKDSVRSGGGGDADDFWKDSYLVSATGANAGKARRITAFANVDGAFTIASAFPNTVAVNDLFAIKRFVNANDVEFSPDLNRIVRNTLGKGLGRSIPITILEGASAAFSAHVTGSGTYPAADTALLSPPLSDLYRAAMGKATSDKPSAVSGGASTTAVVDITTGKHEQFSIGNLVLVEDVNASGIIIDEARWIVGKTDGGAGVDQLHVKPAFTVAPATGKRVYASTTFGMITSGHPRVTIEIYQPDGTTDGQVVILRNCLANLELSGDASNLLAVKFDVVGSELSVSSMGASHFSRTISNSEVDDEPTAFGPVQTTNGEFGFRTAPAASATGTAYSGSLRDGTKITLANGNTIARKRTFNSSTGVASTFVSARNPTLSLSLYLEGAFPDFADLKDAVIKDLQVQFFGNKEVSAVVKGTVFALRVPYAIVSDYKQGDQDGVLTLDLTMEPAVDKSEGFEDPDLGGVAHNSPLIDDEFRFGIV